MSAPGARYDVHAATALPCRVRDRAMKAAGLEVLRFTSSDVAREPQRVVRELSAAIRQRDGSGAARRR